MACQHGLPRGGAEPEGAEGRGRGGKAVDQHRDTIQRAAEKDAAQPRQVKAAELGKHVQRIAGIRAVDGDAPADCRQLALQTLVREAGPPPGDALRV